MGRYSLVMETLANEKIPVLFNENGRDKCSLPTIDSFTTHLVNDRDLIEVIAGRRQLISNLQINADAIKNFKSFIIIYNKDGEHHLPVAYDDKVLLQKISQSTESSTIDINNKVFNSFVFDFLSMIEDSHFYEYLMSQNVLNLKLTEYVVLRRLEGDYSNFCLNKIKEYMSNYKQFRDVYFVYMSYTAKHVETKEENDEYDPDIDFHPTPDEVDWYNRYQAAFDKDFSCHDEERYQKEARPKKKIKKMESSAQLSLFEIFKESN